MSNLSLMCRCAVSDGTPLRSLYVAVVVGTVLNLINRGDALLGSAPINWTKVMLTYAVPYAVSTYGAVSYRMSRSIPEPALATFSGPQNEQ